LVGSEIVEVYRPKNIQIFLDRDGLLIEDASGKGRSLKQIFGHYGSGSVGHDDGAIEAEPLAGFASDLVEEAALLLANGGPRLREPGAPNGVFRVEKGRIESEGIQIGFRWPACPPTIYSSSIRFVLAMLRQTGPE